MVKRFKEGTLDYQRGNLQAILAVVSQRCVCFVMKSWRLNRVIFVGYIRNFVNKTLLSQQPWGIW